MPSSRRSSLPQCLSSLLESGHSSAIPSTSSLQDRRSSLPVCHGRRSIVAEWVEDLTSDIEQGCMAVEDVTTELLHHSKKQGIEINIVSYWLCDPHLIYRCQNSGQGWSRFVKHESCKEDPDWLQGGVRESAAGLPRGRGEASKRPRAAQARVWKVISKDSGKFQKGTVQASKRFQSISTSKRGQVGIQIWTQSRTERCVQVAA